MYLRSESCEKIIERGQASQDVVQSQQIASENQTGSRCEQQELCVNKTLHKQSISASLTNLDSDRNSTFRCTPVLLCGATSKTQVGPLIMAFLAVKEQL